MLEKADSVGKEALTGKGSNEYYYETMFNLLRHELTLVNRMLARGV